MSAAEVLIREGKQEGRQEGKQEATLQHVEGLLDAGVDKKLIAKALKLSLTELDALIAKIKR